jgi:DNA-binding Lrp family transcriptional regulator
MDTASWKSRLLRIFNIGENPRKQNTELSEVKSFKDQQKKEAAFDTRDRGIRTVPLRRIVGSVGRYHDFDNQFRFKQNRPSERFQWIKESMRQGRPLKPVELYEIKDEYFILDGNHRISAAKALGHDEILAHIVEFIPSKNTLQNILYRERAEFSDRTQLPALQREQEDKVSFKEAALDWYRTIYRPLCAIIQRNRLMDSFPERTDADLYAYITFHQWKQGRKRRYGIGMDNLISKNMEDFRNKMNELKDVEYPEMKQGITVFILMNVDAKKESKLIEKLYELEEVKEIHSVHGNVDFLVKVVLTRDLLSSDAEIVHQFVHQMVRQLPGVQSTQTLIPGFSKIRPPEADQDNSGESR